VLTKVVIYGSVMILLVTMMSSYVQRLESTDFTPPLPIDNTTISIEDEKAVDESQDTSASPPPPHESLATTPPDQQQPNINASALFDTHTMVLGDNVKNLVILVPNEAHESTNQTANQFHLANQPYLPQNAVVNTGTAITWFNGDVDHDRSITVVRGTVLIETESSTGPYAAVFDSGPFEYSTATTPVTFNDTGVYTYFEEDVNEDDPAFVMNGTIDVINQPESLPSDGSDTVGVLMVPTQDIQTYTTDLQNRGFAIESTHNFKDLRGGQSGTGDEQTLVVWATSGMTLPDIVTNLQEFTLDLPYS
jgi:plastocyanin